MKRVNNVVVISDLHSGCRLALCPPEGATLDDGGHYRSSVLQKKLWSYWRYFWDRWVPVATKHEPFAVVVNGDTLDGVHHHSTTQISHNLGDQEEIAYNLLWPIVQKCEGRFYMIRGTEAHVGSSAVQEESLAKRLGARKNRFRQASRYQMRMKIGKKGLIHFAHHIGVTGSMAYETTALGKELTEIYADACRWGRQRPDVVVRSHRHKHCQISVPTNRNYGIVFVTAAWQLHTPFFYRMSGGRTTQPQIGGSLIRQGDRELFAEHFTRDIEPEAAVVI